MAGPRGERIKDLKWLEPLWEVKSTVPAIGGQSHRNVSGAHFRVNMSSIREGREV